MTFILKIISFIALAVTIVPAFLALFGTIDVPTYKKWMLVGTIGWFLTAPFWIFKTKKDDSI